MNLHSDHCEPALVCSVPKRADHCGLALVRSVSRMAWDHELRCRFQFYPQFHVQFYPHCHFQCYPQCRFQRYPQCQFQCHWNSPMHPLFETNRVHMSSLDSGSREGMKNSPKDLVWRWLAGQRHLVRSWIPKHKFRNFESMPCKGDQLSQSLYGSYQVREASPIVPYSRHSSLCEDTDLLFASSEEVVLLLPASREKRSKSCSWRSSCPCYFEQGLVWHWLYLSPYGSLNASVRCLEVLGGREKPQGRYLLYFLITESTRESATLYLLPRVAKGSLILVLKLVKYDCRVRLPRKYLNGLTLLVSFLVSAYVIHFCGLPSSIAQCWRVSPRHSFWQSTRNSLSRVMSQ